MANTVSGRRAGETLPRNNVQWVIITQSTCISCIDLAFSAVICTTAVDDNLLQLEPPHYKCILANTRWHRRTLCINVNDKPHARIWKEEKNNNNNRFILLSTCCYTAYITKTSLPFVNLIKRRLVEITFSRLPRLSRIEHQSLRYSCFFAIWAQYWSKIWIGHPRVSRNWYTWPLPPASPLHPKILNSILAANSNQSAPAQLKAQTKYNKLASSHLTIIVCVLCTSMYSIAFLSLQSTWQKNKRIESATFFLFEIFFSCVF